ncbi:MAG: FHA domain-containing protein [Ignavibacteriales bacterium]|nr:FHA domain-containing protein [Ignavibacteriales bacterium]
MKKIPMLFFLPVSMLLSQSARVLPYQTFKPNQDSVKILFKLLDAEGQPVESLQKEEIRVRDDGTEVAGFQLNYQQIPSREKAYFVLVLDASGSMRSGGKIDRLKASSIAFIDALSSEDFCSIILFSSKARLAAGFTGDKTLLKERVWDIVPGGHTAIYDGIYEAMNQLQAQPPQRNKTILLICDSEDEGKSLFTLSDVMNRMREMRNLTIHVFDVNTKQEMSDLRRLAQLSRGTYTFAPTSYAVSSGFARFLNQNRMSYALTYRIGSDKKPTIHKVLISFPFDGVQQQFETEYESSFSSSAQLLPGKPVYYVGGIFLVLAGIGGALVFVRKRKGSTNYPASHRGNEKLDEPRMVFNQLEQFRSEQTRSMGYPEIDVDERTVILDQRKRKQHVLGYLAVKGPGKDEVIEIESHEVLIGRSPQCRVLCSDQSVSRLHAKIRKESDGFVVYDLGSANGTFVNGEEIQKNILKEGDKIEIGNYVIEFAGVPKTDEQSMKVETV